MKLMILDGNSIINRAFYGVRLLSTKDGVYTNAIYGFLNILERLRADEQPDALCVAFDLKAPTFRHLAYDGYKATRHPMPEELAMQMPLMKEVLGAMNIPIYECEGWEADDILGTAGEICAREGEDCVIVTGDRDSLQLVTDRVTVKLVTSKSGQTITTNYTPDVFHAEYGFDPVRLVDLKSLMGDSSDNIPGVSGIGPKTATSLLLSYGTLDGIYEHLPEIKESVRKKLEKDREQAYMSYDLATIRKNAPVDFIPERNLVREVDNDALYALFHRLEFTRLIARYGLHAPQEAPKPQQKLEAVCTCETVTDAAQAREIAARLSDEHYVNLIATDDLSKIAVQLEDACFLFSGEAVLDNDFMSTLFGASVKKVTHDCKSLMRTLLERGIPADGFIFDTALAAYDLDATRGDYKLDDVFSQYCGAQIGYADEQTVGKDAAEQTALLAQAVQSRRSMRCCPGSCANAAWKSSIMRSSCRFARCWRGWRRGACSSIRWRLSRSVICSSSASKKIRRIFSAMPGRNLTSTLPSSWARSCLNSWGFRPSRRRKAATRRMRRSLKSSRAATQSSRRSWTTGRSRS